MQDANASLADIEMPPSKFFDCKKVTGERGERMVRVAVTPMSKEQARRAYHYRPNTKYAESRFGGDNLYDDVCLLLNGHAARCRMCHAPTRNTFLSNGTCPDCDGRSEYNGTDPAKA